MMASQQSKVFIRLAFYTSVILRQERGKECTQKVRSLCFFVIVFSISSYGEFKV